MALAEPTSQLARSGSMGFAGFWSEWTFPKGLVFTWLAIWGSGTPFYDSMGLTAPDWWEPVAALVMFLCVVYWISDDSRRFRDIAAQYGGFALYVFWPLLLPFYLFHSRGWRRASAALLLTVMVWIGSILAGAILGAIISTL